MKVAFDPQAFTLQAYGGVSRYFSRLAGQLGQMGQTVGIFAPYYQNRYLDELPATMVHGRPIRKYPLQTKRLFLAYNNRAARRSIRRWQPHIVHETYFSRLAATPRYCPAVVTVYDMIHELYPDHLYPWDRTAHLKTLAIRRAAHVICISDNTRKDVIRLLGIPEAKLSVVHLGMDHFAVSPQPEATTQPVCAFRPYLLYVGHRNGYKNFGPLIRAIASSPFLRNNFFLIAFGGGPFSHQEKHFITKQGLSLNRVKQISGNDKTLSWLYQHAEAFIYPSLYEGFGIPPLEAMAHHCPVIASNGGSMPEVLGDAAAYFAPSSLESMRDTLESTLSSGPTLQALARKGDDRVRHFSWRRCAEQTLAIYQQVRA